MANTVQIVISAVDRTHGLHSLVHNFTELEKKAKSLGVALAYVGAVAGTALVGAMGAAAIAIAENTLAAIKYADEAGKMAQQAGMAVDEFTRLSYVATLADVSHEDLIRATKALSAEMVKEGRGAESVSAEILRLSDQFASSADGAGKTALAVDKFGRSGQRLIPMLNKGSDAIRAEMEEAEKFKQVIGPGFAHAAQDFEDNQKRLQLAMKGIWLVAAQDALPTLNELIEKTIAWVKVGNRIQEIGEKIGFTINFALRLGEQVADLKNVLGLFTTTGIKSGELVGKAWLMAGEDMKRAKEMMAQAADEADKTPIINADDVLKAYKIEESIQVQRMRGGEQLREQARIAFQERLDQIAKLQIDESQGIILSQKAFLEYQQRLTEIKQQGEDIRAELDYYYRQADVNRYIQALQSQEGHHLEFMDAMRGLADTYRELWSNSLQAVDVAFVHFASTAIRTFSDGFGSAIADIVTGAQSAEQAFANLGKQMLGMLAKFIAQLIINSLLAAVLQKTIAGATLAAITPIASAWAAAATAASIATLGGATSAGALIPPLMAANAAAGAAIAIGAGAAHGGLDYVPRESTWLLDEGERVMSPRQNVRMEGMLDAFESGALTGGGRGQSVQLILDGSVLAEWVYNGTRDGRIQLHPRVLG